MVFKCNPAPPQHCMVNWVNTGSTLHGQHCMVNTAPSPPQAEPHGFQAKAAGDFARLRRLQGELESDTGQQALLGCSVAETVRMGVFISCSASGQLLLMPYLPLTPLIFCTRKIISVLIYCVLLHSTAFHSSSTLMSPFLNMHTPPLHKGASVLATGQRTARCQGQA